MFVLLQEQNVYTEASFKSTSPGQLAAKQAVTATEKTALSEGWIWHQLHDAPTLWIPECSQNGSDVRLRWHGDGEVPVPPELANTGRKVGEMQAVGETFELRYQFQRDGKLVDFANAKLRKLIPVRLRVENFGDQLVASMAPGLVASLDDDLKTLTKAEKPLCCVCVDL